MWLDQVTWLVRYREEEWQDKHIIRLVEHKEFTQNKAKKRKKEEWK